MADVEAQQAHSAAPATTTTPKPLSNHLSRLRAHCTTTKMAETNKHIVPMPAWSSIVGIARLAIAILVLAFTAAATAIFGGYTAFGFTLFTVPPLPLP